MPCNSDYLAPNAGEKNMSQVVCLLDELAGKSFTKLEWIGYHKKAYGAYSKEKLDSLVAELCKILHTVDVTKHSLEMQIWWRDHQKADKVRKGSEYD